MNGGSGVGARTYGELREAGLLVSKAATRLATALVAVVCCGYGFTTAIGVLQNFGGGDAVAVVVYTIVILGLQIGYFSRPGAVLTSRRNTLAVVALAAVVYLPVLHLGEAWVAFGGFLAASLLIAVPWPWSAIGYAAVVALSGVALRQFGDEDLSGAYPVVYSVLATAITGLVIYGLTRLARLVDELHNARDELSRMAVAEERLRFARDAHDLLGLSLSTISLKAELAHRLVLTEPERARTEIGESLVVARRALGEVRMVAAGNASLSLAEELVSARSVLEAAEIDTSVQGADTVLPEEIATLFATLVREAATNILRHSKADACSIRVSTVNGSARIAVTNDRAAESGSVPDERRGSGQRGIGNLRARLEERGGRLTTTCDEGEFTLVGSVPVEIDAPVR